MIDDKADELFRELNMAPSIGVKKIVAPESKGSVAIEYCGHKDMYW